MALYAETYRYTLQDGLGDIVWDVLHAKRLVATGGCPLMPVDREQQAHVARTYDISEAKVAAADIRQPGIAAPMIWLGSPQYGPPRHIVYVLIDGIHRTVRAFRDGQPFSAYVLSDAQSRACLLSAPEGMIP
jgi:hypothetical protein